ncbi:hypothetical protein GCM10017673_13320 [Streptosporangium violaceochromogenes]|nr:hypothetical protein GCM10017673_13320 [Streptosporangium violaceochromogenes]
MTAKRTEAVGHLRRLASHLEVYSLKARLRSSPGSSSHHPHLHVVNPVAPAVTEDVIATDEENGEWWFWLSWAGRIGQAEDVATAAERVAGVLYVMRR